MSYFKKSIASLTILSIFWNNVAFCMEDNADPTERKVPVRLSNVELTEVSSPVSPDSSASPKSPSPDLNELDLRSPSSPDSNRQDASSLERFAETYPYAAEFLRSMRWDPSNLMDGQFPIDLQISDKIARVECFTYPPRYETIDRRVGNLLYSLVLGTNGVSYTDAEKPGTECCCSLVDCSSRVLVRGRSLLLKSTRARQKAIVITELREGLIDGLDFLSKSCFGAAYLAQLILAHAPNPFDVISQSTATIGIAKLFTEHPSLFVFPASVVAAIIAKVLWNVCRVEDPTMDTINTHEARLQTVSQGCWEDYTRQIFPLSTLKRGLGNLRHQNSWAGELPIDAREKAFNILVKLAQNQTGYSQTLAMRTLAEVVSGIHLNDYEKLTQGYSKAVLIHNLSIKSRALSVLQTLREDLHQRKGCNFTLINAIYNDYLLWRHGYSPSNRSALGISVLVLASLTHSITSFITLCKAIYEYIKCPQKPGFTFAGGYAPWASTFSKRCFDELVKRFGIFPGQPARTLTDSMSDYHLGTSYDLDLSNKGLDGDTINDILRGFRANGIAIRSLNLAGNFVNKARDFRTLASTAPDLETLNLSNNGIEGFYAGSGPDDTVALGESLGNWTAIEELDLSDNPIESQDFTGTRAIANSFRRLPRLNSFKIARAQLGYLGSDGLQALGNGTQSLTSLAALDVSGNPLENVDSVGSTDLMEKLPSSLTSLDVSDCQLGAQDTASFTALGNNFWRLPSLARLRISGNHMVLAGDEGFLSFVQNLRLLTNLGEFVVNPQIPGLNSTHVADFNQEQRHTRIQRNLSIPLHTPEDVDAYLGSLPNTTTTFNLSALIGDQGIVGYLMNRLANSTVVVFDMSNNWLEFFNDDGSVAFGNGIQNLTTLIRVLFRNNFIGKWGSRGEKAIGNGLKPLPSVEVVDGSHNLIGYTGSDGEVALAEGLQPSTRRVDFSYNWLGGTSTRGPIALGRRMDALLNLGYVDLSHTYLAVWGPDGVVLIANNLKSLLTYLNLESTTIGSTGTNDTVALSTNLPRFRDIRQAKFAFNNIGLKGSKGVSQLLETLPELRGLEDVTLAGAQNVSWSQGAQVQEALYGERLRAACEAQICFGTPLNSEDASDQTQQPQESPSPIQLTSASSSDTREASQQTQESSPSPKPVQLSEGSASVVESSEPLPVQQLLTPSSVQSSSTSPRLELSEPRLSSESTQSQKLQPSTSTPRTEISTPLQTSSAFPRLELPESRLSSESTQSPESQPTSSTSTTKISTLPQTSNSPLRLELPKSRLSSESTQSQESQPSTSSSRTEISTPLQTSSASPRVQSMGPKSVRLPRLVQTSSASPKAQPMGTGFWNGLKSWFSFDAWVESAQQAAFNLMFERDPETGRLVNTMPATFPNALDPDIHDWAQPTDSIDSLSLNAASLQSAQPLLAGPQLLAIGRP